jgi:hypothetical protein
VFRIIRLCIAYTDGFISSCESSGILRDGRLLNRGIVYSLHTSDYEQYWIICVVLYRCSPCILSNWESSCGVLEFFTII